MVAVNGKTHALIPLYAVGVFIDFTISQDNQAARRLKSALVGREHTVIADVPYRREH